MKKIASFTVDHTKLDTGIYVSRITGFLKNYIVQYVRHGVDLFNILIWNQDFWVQYISRDTYTKFNDVSYQKLV